VTRQRFCPECGLVDQPEGSDRCAECRLTVLDDEDPANKDAIAEAITLRKQILQPSWMLPGAFAAGGIAFLVGSWLGKDMAFGELAMYVALFAWFPIMGAASKRRLSPQWLAAIEHFDGGPGSRALRHRTRTSMTAIAALVLVMFVGVQLKVGTANVVYARGYPAYKIFTSMLSHSGPIHLIGNLLALLAFGIAIDLRVGRPATAVILVASGIGGSLAQAAYSPEAMLGFSGAILGLAGATVALMPTRKTVLVLQGIAVPMPTWLWAIFWIGILTLTGWADSRQHVAWVAHLGGFATGLVLALPMRRLAPTASFDLYEQRRAERVERLASR
jgi:membrane associated rhomboid family serine protease